jgi:hypothetical protein
MSFFLAGGNGDKTSIPRYPMRSKSNLIEPVSTLMAIFMLSAISMTTAAVFFMSSTVAAFRYENGKTTAEHDQQEPDYH